VIERLRGLAGGPVRLVVVTTKEGRFARKLLARAGFALDPAQVYGKEARRPKRTILLELCADGDAAGVWFVEDRIRTLEDVKTEPALARAKLFLAAWGYNTEDDREAARRDGRIVLLTLERFAGDLAQWPAQD
jgi:phosphoglycolate phosphatase-like HAD superfamily hydrolase